MLCHRPVRMRLLAVPELPVTPVAGAQRLAAGLIRGHSLGL